MRHARSFSQDFTETFQKHSEARILDLFQKRYAHSLIVSLTTVILLLFIACPLFIYILVKLVLVALGLMILQQLGGSNAIAYYASSIFVEAGKFLMASRIVSCKY